MKRIFSDADVNRILLVERGFVSTYSGGNPKLIFTRGSLSTDVRGQTKGMDLEEGFFCIDVRGGIEDRYVGGRNECAVIGGRNICADVERRLVCFGVREGIEGTDVEDRFVCLDSERRIEGGHGGLIDGGDIESDDVGREFICLNMGGAIEGVDVGGADADKVVNGKGVEGVALFRVEEGFDKTYL